MAAPDTVVNLDEKFAAFEEHWSPRVIGQINDLQLKAVKVQGDFVWHSHDETDELFLVRSGHLTIRLRDRDDVTIGPGELFIVPRGVEHCPSARDECEILLLEPTGVVNTGDADAGDLTARDEWIETSRGRGRRGAGRHRERRPGPIGTVDNPGAEEQP